MNISATSLLIGFIAGIIIYALYVEIKRLRAEMTALREDRVKALPHGTLATLEDIHAVVNDLRFQNADVNDVVQALMKAVMTSQAMRRYEDESLQRIKELVSDIQTAPRKYKDRPNRKVKIA